jgi:intraflagellar transport protein 88
VHSKLRLLEVAVVFSCNIFTQDDPASNVILEVIKTDSLRKLERGMRQEAERSILTAAKLISPVIEDSFSAGTMTSFTVS